MSGIDALIAQLCPDGVEFVALGEVGTIFGGLTGKSKADFSDGNARFVSYVNVFNNVAVDTSANDFVSVAPAERQRALQRGDVLFTGSSETAEEVAMSAVVTVEVDEPLYLNSFSIGYRFDQPDIFDPDFIKHLFRSAGLRKQLVKTASGVTRFNVSKARLATVKIPLLPTAIQCEIASILDKMNCLQAELEAELEAELDLRRSQFAHYREELFDFSGATNVPLRAIGDLGTIFRGKRFTKGDYVTSGGIGAIHYGEIYTKYGTTADAVASRVREDLAPGLRYARRGDVVLTDVGETVADVGKAVAWLGDEEVAVHDHCYVIRSDVNATYLSYLMQTVAFARAKDRHIARTKVKTLLLDGLKRIAVPIPSESEQLRVVEILEAFDLLTSDLAVGLPAEIEARRKQYQYYRDRLLTFEEAVA